MGSSLPHATGHSHHLANMELQLCMWIAYLITIIVTYISGACYIYDIAFLHSASFYVGTGYGRIIIAFALFTRLLRRRDDVSWVFVSLGVFGVDACSLNSLIDFCK